MYSSRVKPCGIAPHFQHNINSGAVASTLVCISVYKLKVNAMMIRDVQYICSLCQVHLIEGKIIHSSWFEYGTDSLDHRTSLFVSLSCSSPAPSVPRCMHPHLICCFDTYHMCAPAGAATDAFEAEGAHLPLQAAELAAVLPCPPDISGWDRQGPRKDCQMTQPPLPNGASFVSLLGGIND